MLETCLFVKKKQNFPTDSCTWQSPRRKQPWEGHFWFSVQVTNQFRDITSEKYWFHYVKKHEVFGGVCWRGIRGERVSVSRLTYAAVSVLTISSGSST